MQANEAWQEGLAANGVTLSEQVCELEAKRGLRPCAPTLQPSQVWELEAKMQQWEFAFVSANGRKPSFMERREDATQVRRATELIELRQRSASLHRVLSAVNSYTIRDGLLEAKQPAVLAALALFLSVDVNHDGRVAEYELEPCASMPLPRASWWPSEHPSCHPVCIQAAHLCSRRLCENFQPVHPRCNPMHTR